MFKPVYQNAIQIFKIRFLDRKYRPVTGDYLDYDDVMAKYDDKMDTLAALYLNTLHVIHNMHDKNT